MQKIINALEASKGSNFLTTPALRMAELPICLDQQGSGNHEYFTHRLQIFAQQGPIILTSTLSLE
jgi:hypothetical protein